MESGLIYAYIFIYLDLANISFEVVFLKLFKWSNEWILQIIWDNGIVI